jgi:hypothetical protein
MLGRTFENAALGRTGSAERTDISGHPVADNLGSDQAGSGRGVGEREGEPNGMTLGGDEGVLLGFGDGLFVLGDFWRTVPLVKEGEGLLAGMACLLPEGSFAPWFLPLADVVSRSLKS